MALPIPTLQGTGLGLSSSSLPIDPLARFYSSALSGFGGGLGGALVRAALRYRPVSGFGGGLGGASLRASKKLGKPRKKAAPLSLEEQARRIVMAIFAPQARELQAQLAGIDKTAQERAEFMKRVFADFAAFLKTLVPETQAIYQRAASDISAFSKAYSLGLAAAENLSSQQVGDILSTIGAPSGAAPPALDAGGKLYAITGYLPAATLEQQGASAAKYLANLPGIYLQLGANEIAKLLAEAERQKSEIRGQLAELATKSEQEILREIHQLRAEQRAEQRLGLQAQTASDLAWYRQKTIELRQKGLSQAQARFVASQKERWRDRMIQLWDRGLITARSFWRVMGDPSWRSKPNKTKLEIDKSYRVYTAFDRERNLVITIGVNERDPSDVVIGMTKAEDLGVPPVRESKFVKGPHGSTWIVTWDPRDPIGTVEAHQAVKGEKPPKRYKSTTIVDPVTGDIMIIWTDPEQPGKIVGRAIAKKGNKIKGQKLKVARIASANLNTAAMRLSAMSNQNDIARLLGVTAPSGQDVRANHEAVFSYLRSVYLKPFGEMKVEEGLVQKVVLNVMRIYRLGRWWRAKTTP